MVLKMMGMVNQLTQRVKEVEFCSWDISDRNENRHSTQI